MQDEPTLAQGSAVPEIVEILRKWETAGAVLEICLFSALLWRLLGVFLEELLLFTGV